MPNFHKVIVLPYDTQELFYLVLNVELYHEFLPWCKVVKIISNNDNQIIAELITQLKGFSNKYWSKITYSNDLQKQNYSIEVEAISGPFKHLKNSWQFSQENASSKIEFFIDFKMKFTVVDKLVSILFSDASKEMVSAFKKRADTILTKRNYNK